MVKSLIAASLVGLTGTAASIGPFASFARASETTETQSREQLTDVASERPLDAPAATAQYLGRHLLVGFSGTEMSDSLRKMIREVRPGGVVVFARNVKDVEQLRRLTRSLQAESIRANGRRLIVAIDQEGGNVVRIKHNPSLPSALAIASTDSVQTALLAGQATGRLLKSVGVNVNFAPVLDVTDPYRDRFLGSRVYGKDPHKVAEMGLHFARGLSQQGVLPVAKHFPGHGSANHDSHVSFANSKSDLKHLKAHDLVPFQKLSSDLNSPWGVMLAHVSFPKIDASGVPATFSRKIVTEILRDQINRDALVITDDLEMRGASVEADTGRRAVRALKAGADMVMIAWNPQFQRAALKSLIQAYSSKELSADLIAQSQYRIRFHEGMAPDERQSRNPARPVLAEIEANEFKQVASAVLQSIRAPLKKPSAELYVQPEGSDLIVLASRSDTQRKFKAVADPIKPPTTKIVGVPLGLNHFSETIDQIRKRPLASVIAFSGGESTARLISSLPEDIARRTTVIHIDIPAMVAKHDRFFSHVEAFYRHPDLAKVIAQRFFAQREKLSQNENSLFSPKLETNAPVTASEHDVLKVSADRVPTSQAQPLVLGSESP